MTEQASSVREAYAKLGLIARPSQGSGPSWPRVLVNLACCGTAVGGEAVAAALRAEIRRLGLGARVVAGGCAGDCWTAPSLLLQRPDGAELFYERVTPEMVPEWVETALAGGASGSAGRPGPGDGREGRAELPPGLSEAERTYFARQERRLLTRAGRVDPVSLDEAIQDGLYRGLAKALAELTPEEVIAEVERSGLRGRGGAYFPVHLKWASCRAAAREPRILVVNAEEGEPGIYKDRHLMEGDPHRLIEGILIAAYAIGASRAVIYINGEAPISFARMAAAVDRARSVGLIGQRILGSDFVCEMELRQGAGGYILGEETTLINSVEGRRPEPRLRPPFPTEAGLDALPTVINNAETLANVPGIVDRGADWFVSAGAPGATGTKLINLAGPIHRPGLVEVPMGTPMRTVIDDIGGGLIAGRLAGIHVGGPSGSLVGPESIDTPLEPAALQQVGGILGAGGVVPFTERACPVQLARYLTLYNRLESCGKCTPCREGTPRLLDLLGGITGGTATPATLDQVNYLNDVLTVASLCGLGQMAPNPIRSLLQHFPDEVRAHLEEHRCSAGVCRFEQTAAS